MGRQDPSKSPEQKVIKTLIYGVKSSGNQAEFALRKIAQLSKEEYPEVNNIVQDDIFVDDFVTGEKDPETAHHRADELELVLNRVGFQLKGIVEVSRGELLPSRNELCPSRDELRPNQGELIR